jgi:putative membrane protein
MASSSNGELATDSKTNESTQLARTRTSLAIERSFLATERTLMAWLRTSLSMISFGFTLVKFFEYLENERGAPVVGRFGATWSPRALGMAMVLIGTGALIAAVIQQHRRVNALRREGMVAQWNLAYWVAIVVAALGAFALVSLVLGA